LEASFRRYNETFLNNISEQHNKFQNSCNESFQFCQAHRETFSSTWSKLKKRISVSDNASNAFEASFAELMDKVLADFQAKNTDNAEVLSNKLSAVGETEKAIKTDIRDIEAVKENYDQELNQMYQLLDTVYVELNKIKSKAKLSSEKLTSHLKSVKSKTEANELNITELSAELKEKSADLGEDIRMTVDEQIKPAVKTATADRKKLLGEMKSQAKKLNEVNEETSNHIGSSLQTLLTVNLFFFIGM
jgi:hypothetical protein